MGSGASGEFVMDTAQVKIIGSRFADFSSRYKNLMTQMRTTIEDLGTCWKSEDYNQFLSIYEQNSETIDQMSFRVLAWKYYKGLIQEYKILGEQ